MTTAYDTDHLALEDLLVSRVRDELAADSLVPERNVFTAADLADVEERQQQTPAVHVIYAGDELVGGGDAEGGAQVLAQRWYTVVAVRNVRDTRGGAGVRTVAGPILARLIRALSDWTPGPGYTALIRRQGPEAAYSAGFAYYPLLWSSNIVTLGGSS